MSKEKESENRPEKVLAVLPDASKYTPEQQGIKHRLIRRSIIICILLIPLFIWLQNLAVEYEDSLPFSSKALIFLLINFNVILVLLILFLVLRYLAELVFERNLKLLGSKLKTRLVASFLALSLIPTILLFFIALQFVSTSMDYWFNVNIENSLQESLRLAQQILHDHENKAAAMGQAVKKRLAELDSYDAPAVNAALNDMLEVNRVGGPDAVTIIFAGSSLTLCRQEFNGLKFPEIPIEIMQKAEQDKYSGVITQETPAGDLIRAIDTVQVGKDMNNRAVLITSLVVAREQMNRMTKISSGLEGYRQLKYFKGPFKFWLLIILVIITLLIIFAAIWFGLHIARSITDPIDKLLAATQRIAGGDLEVKMEQTFDDEMGRLVKSFNEMTNNLNLSSRQLADTHAALEKSSQESEQRRIYTEIILQNVSAGVVSMDNTGRITTVNRFAEKLLNIDRDVFVGRGYNDILSPEHAILIDAAILRLDETGKSSIEDHIRISVLQETHSLLVNFTKLTDYEENPVGYVLVFDDLTKIEKMQRMAAWREVARRIAHEIKNPLTPIRLSAQRLRKKYPEIIAGDKIFDKCTKTIINQVDEIKVLVNEFSLFARMPKVSKSLGNLAELCRDTINLYMGHKEIQFTFTEDKSLPQFYFDHEQIKRCIINLLDNAVAVLPDGGNIDIDISRRSDNESVLLSISDNGSGISRENKKRLFEPYFSTKKTGTGLGLSIVSTIVADHDGYIRVKDNRPHGSIFVIELPLLIEATG